MATNIIPHIGKKHGNYKSIAMPCDACGLPMEKQPWQIKRSKQHFCTQECYKSFSRRGSISLKGYWVYMGVPVHILIVEMFIGRKIPKKYVIHHINGIRHDNRLRNLLVISRSDHNSYHKSHCYGKPYWVDKAAELRATGMSYGAIGRVFGFSSHRTVPNALAKYKQST